MGDQAPLAVSIGRRLLEVVVKNPEELHFQAGFVLRLSLFGLSQWLGRT